jgi:Secretion system C-terminal sorting domain
MFFMKKISNLWIAFCLLVATATCLTVFTGCGENKQGEEMEENDMYDGADKAIEFEIERTKDPATGKVPWGKLWDAIQQTEQSKNSSSNFTSALSWIERGPDGDFTVGGNPRAPGAQTGGRIRGCMIDSLDPTRNTVWVGGVDGGLWKTTNISASPANWTLVNDNLANLAVAAMCQDPRPGFQNIMYFCTGESFQNGDAVRGIGVFKSTDAGATWNLLPSSASYISGTRILCDFQGNVYLGTRNTGLVRSTDGGTSWTTITPAGIGTSVCDLEISSTAQAARLHVTTGIGNTSGYSYTDNPATVTSASGWTAATTPFTTFNQRTELGISGNVLYACPDNGSGQVPTIWKTTDGGANWAAIASQPNGGTWANGQGWYSLSCGINPSNSNEVIVGGLDTWKSTNGGNSWTQLSGWASGAANFYVHADQHNIQWWDGGNKLILTNDGGVWYSTDGGTTKTDRNKGLRLKQFYSVAIHPTKPNYFIAGAQDNGMHRLDHPGLDSSAEVVGGDGCYSAIDQSNGNFQFGSYVGNVYRRSTNNGLNWTTPVNLGTGRFVNPWDYDNNNFKIYGSNNTGGVFFRWNDPRTGGNTELVSVAAFGGGNVSAAHVSPYTANRVYFGTGTGTGAGNIIRVDNADVGTSIAGTLINAGAGMPAGGYVNCIVTGSDDQHLMACFSSYGVQNVWVTSNGGTTWTACDGNLPDMPVRWALYHPDSDTKAFIATETGVWETDLLNGAATVWTANSTFPNVRTDMIKYRASDRTIAAGTHGRGIWTATVSNVTCTPASITTNPVNSTICAANNTTFSVVAGGTAPLAYQWQLSTTGAGGPWNPIANGGVYSGATNATLTITGATIGMNTYQYRCVVTGNCAPLTATSNPAILTVNPGTTVTGQPANSTICAGANTSFSVTATGSSLTYQWQLSTNGGGTYTNLTNVAPYSNVTAATMNITAATAGLDGNLYRCVVGSACTPINSTGVLLTVNSGPAVTSQPGNTAVCAGNAATFTVAATGGGLTYQWQESTNGGANWNNLANAAPYSNVTTTTLTINPTVVGMNNNQYRCVVTGACPSPVNSNAGVLTVGTALTITSQPASQTICAGANTSFAVTISGTVNAYQWQESTNGGGSWNNINNGGVYSGATTATLNLTAVTAGMNNNQYRCVVTGSCPAINSNAATLTVNTAPAITAQPGNPIVYTGSPASFSITATGTGLNYQWQFSATGCGGAWVNIANAAPYSGVNTPTLTINPTTTGLNGAGFRCVVTGTCTSAATSNCGILTVNVPVTITSQPSASTLCAGAQTSFTVGAAGTTPTYQWQESTNGGGTWNNITNGGVYSGATTATLTLTGVTAGMTGYQYRAVVTGAAPGSTATSNAAILTVNTAPAITTQPVAGTTICETQNTAYSVAANGTALTYQWQLSTDGGTAYTNLANGGVYSGVTTATLNITAATASMNGNRYRVVINGTCAPAVTSSAAVLTVNTAITVTTAPAAATICATGTTSFSIAVAGTSPTYQWQVSTNGGTTWTNITNSGIYSGATTTTLTLTGVIPAMNGYLYRAVVNGTAACGAINSAAAALTVSAQPTVSLAASPYLKLLPGKTTTITAAVTPAAGFTTVWTWSGGSINVTGNTYLVDVNHLGTYTVVATIGSCISVPATITILDSVSSKLFIYPSPNDGRFTISYYSPGATASNKTSQNISIYAADGRLVLNKKYDVVQPYQLHQMDLRAYGSGVYYVVLSLANGDKIKTGEVIIR